MAQTLNTYTLLPGEATKLRSAYDTYQAAVSEVKRVHNIPVKDSVEFNPEFTVMQRHPDTSSSTSTTLYGCSTAYTSCGFITH